MKKYIEIPKYIPEDIKELILWTRNVQNYDGLELYQDLQVVSHMLVDTVDNAFKHIILKEQLEKKFNDKWGHILK